MSLWPESLGSHLQLLRHYYRGAMPAASRRLKVEINQMVRRANAVSYFFKLMQLAERESRATP